MKFIIDKKLVFDTDENVIYHFEENEKSLHISAIATRLFMEILINPSGVTRDYLLKKVWSEHGLKPSSNNLNNHMSMLRKAVFNVSNNENYITTLPKKGFVFNRRYAVERIESDEINNSPPVVVVRKNKKKYSRALVVLPYVMTLVFACLFILSSDKTHYYLIGKDVFFKYKLCEFKPLKEIPFNKKPQAIGIVEDAIKNNNINCETDGFDVYFYLKNRNVFTKGSTGEFDSFSFCKRENNGDYSYCRNIKSAWDD